MKLINIFNILSFARSNVAKGNEEKALEQVDCALNCLACLLNPEHNKPTMNDFKIFCELNILNEKNLNSMDEFFEVEHEKQYES